MDSLPTPVRREPLAAQVAGRFRALIENGTWPVGARIPGENQLAAELRVSRGTVREALRALSVAGLLDPRVGDGTYVRARDELSALLGRDAAATELEHALDVREVLEAAAARRAARHADREQVRQLEDALAARALAYQGGDRGAYVAADVRFHAMISGICGNPLLSRLYEAVSGVMTDVIRQTPMPAPEPTVEHLHVELVQAIAEHDADKAERIAVDLIEEVKFLSAVLKDDLP